MAELIATVESHNGQLQLNVAKAGSCSGCQKRAECLVPLNLAAATTAQIPAPAGLQVGQQVTLKCDDTQLLRYTAALFLPSLSLLLAVNALLPDSAFGLIGFALRLVLPLLLGVGLSRVLLRGIARQQVT